MSDSYLFNLGLNQKKFLSTSKVTGPAINIGCTRGRGSTTRMFNYCKERSENPSLCINQFITLPPILLTAPTAPTITNINASLRQLTITFTPPENNGGSPITNYKYSLDGGSTFILANTTTSPIIISGLTTGTNYNVNMKAVNSVGDGVVSNTYTISTLSQTWSALGVGLGAPVNDILFDSSNSIYVGGTFTGLGNTDPSYNRVAAWNISDSSWNTLGVGLGGSVQALAINNNDIYVGGTFTTLGNGDTSYNLVAKWNGSTWSKLGNGFNKVPSGFKNIATLAFDSYNNILYAGGNFNTAGDISANNIAKWDGTNWSRLGTLTNNGTSGEVSSIFIVPNSNVIYVGGTFNTAGDISANNIAKWDGTNWSRLGTLTINGLNSSVLAMALNPVNNILYVGGNFTRLGTTGPTGYNRIAAWNISDASWNTLGVGLGSQVRNLKFDSVNNILYAAGAFTTLGNGDINYNRVAQWNGTNWSRLGTSTNNGVNSNVLGLTLDLSQNLYLAGFFTIAGGLSIGAGGISANYVAKYG